MSDIVRAYRYHDFSYGHRVFGHENKCQALHGHNGRVHFVCEADKQDVLGRIIDFGVMKTLLCDWVEENWDHRFLVYAEDPWAGPLHRIDSAGVVLTSFNPTAENMALALLRAGPVMLAETGVRLVKVTIDETRKCSASAQLEGARE